MNDNALTEQILGRIRRRAFLTGSTASALLALGAILSPERFFESYLFAYVYWAGIPLGCLGLLLLHHLVSGRWGHALQRFLEAGSRTLPVMAVLFLPIVAGLDHLYPWTHEAAGEGHGHVAAKAAYLNIPFFLVRTGVFFLFWIGVAFLMSRWSRKQDVSRDPMITRNMKRVSAPALIIFVLLGTFASIDWMMSLEPEWFSSIYALMIIAGQALSALAFCVLGVQLLGSSKPLSDLLTETHYHHFGNLLLALTMFWAYLAFSQYLIIWSANLPEETSWYIHRLNGGWSAVGVLILVGHFFVPFFLLLSRKTKRAIRPLAGVAAGLLAMRLIDYFWLIKPAFSPNLLMVHWMDFVATAAIGGLLIGFFVTQFQRAPITVVFDPRFPRSGEKHG